MIGGMVGVEGLMSGGVEGLMMGWWGLMINDGVGIRGFMMGWWS